MMNRFALTIVVLVTDVLSLLLFNNLNICNPGKQLDYRQQDDWYNKRVLIFQADAKGVAGIGKAGSDNAAGSDKAGQQVPPEVYSALTYAGSAFLFTLSVPLILYGLNKVLNKIEDCFGCGPSKKRKLQQQKKQQQLEQQQQQQQQQHQQNCKLLSSNNNGDTSLIQQQSLTGQTDSVGMTLPGYLELNYKTAALQHNLQKPYDICGPYM